MALDEEQQRLALVDVVTKSKDREDGVRELLGIDLFEISIVPHPANADTRFVELKAASTADVTRLTGMTSRPPLPRLTEPTRRPTASAKNKSAGEADRGGRREGRGRGSEGGTESSADQGQEFPCLTS